MTRLVDRKPAVRRAVRGVARGPAPAHGRGRYVDESKLPGMLHAAFVRSDLARARIIRLDVEAARTAPGRARCVYRRRPQRPGAWTPCCRRCLPDGGMGERLAPAALGRRGRALRRRPGRDRGRRRPLPRRGRLRARRNRLRAAAARGRLRAGRTATPEQVHAEEGTQRGARRWRSRSTPASRRSSTRAAHVVTETFHQHRYSDVPMETRASSPATTATSSSSTCGSPARTRTRPRRASAGSRGSPRAVSASRIGDVGGGFGQKYFTGREELRSSSWPPTALGRHRQVDRGPAREPHRRIPRPRGPRDRARSPPTPRATSSAPTSTTSRTSGSYPIGGGSGRRLSACLFPGPYRLPRLAWKTTSVWTNTCGRSAYRAPWMMETTAREQMVDVVGPEARPRPARVAAAQRAAPQRDAATPRPSEWWSRTSRRRSAWSGGGGHRLRRLPGHPAPAAA